MSIIGIGDVLRICETATRVYRNCRDCNGEYKSLTTEARSLSNLLEDISDKFDKIPDGKRKQLEDAYEPCVDVLQELDKLLIHYNSLDTKSKRAWDRVKWDPEKSRTLRDRLTSSVTMLSSFYTSLIHDNQVLILEALERLEHDYKGGHREESIASLERITSGTAEDDEEEDEAAWTQILRDLEDVGVGKQDALSYRDLIIDWLVTAVNEGRLLEEREEPDDYRPLSVGLVHGETDSSLVIPNHLGREEPNTLSMPNQLAYGQPETLPMVNDLVRTEPNSLISLPNDLGAALPSSDPAFQPGTHHLDVPAINPLYQRSQSAPFLPPSPLLTPVPQHYRAQSIPSTVSYSIPEPSGASSYAASYSSETDDTSSLYALPEPASKTAPAPRASSAFIKRVPVPNRDLDLPEVVPTSTTSTVATTTSSPASSPSRSVAPDVYAPPPLRPAPPIPPKTPIPPPVPRLPHPLNVAPQPDPAPALAYDAPPALALSPILPESAQHPLQSSAPEPLPTYWDKESSITADLAWTAQQVLAAWNRRDFSAAAKALEELLMAVERGQTVLATGAQPDCRILRHLLGICNSYTGNFVKAKGYFESVFRTPYLNRLHLDDGDIAAARWLGDVCLHLREHSNAVLAWGVAYEGSLGRYGVVRDRTRRVADELRMLDHWLFIFRRIEHSFNNNIVPTDIFRHTPAFEKSNLINLLKTLIYENGSRHGYIAPPANIAQRPTHLIGPRPRMELGISEGFLLGPLIALGAWPLPWDSTFSPADAIQLDRNMNTVRTMITITPLIERSLPTLSLGDSKKLHYVTKRGSTWLIQTVKKALQEMGIEHTEHSNQPAIICTINQHRDGYAFSEGVQITFKKLQFRSVYGLKVSDVQWSTRIFGPVSMQKTSTVDFRDILKGTLERAENEIASKELHGADMPTFVSLPAYR
ncbi:hypothetical protein GQ44DRAFT_769225 [Phaeosphaeriaceae sp. PMI808]|nr:hypothetical protein GQ44DRAFT_769225 [Phaeosphaeriaceae sp. PMI808]